MRSRVVVTLLGLALLVGACSTDSATPVASTTQSTMSTTTSTAVPTTTASPVSPSTTITDPAAPVPIIGFEKVYGGEQSDRGVWITSTMDGGYVVTGITENTAERGEDAYLLRIGPDGQMMWQLGLGGEGDDAGWSVLEDPEGGFTIAGFTTGFDAEGTDLMIARTDPSGDLQGIVTFGGEGQEFGWAMDRTDDGGIIVAGETSSFGAGRKDSLLVRADAEGEILWTRTYGGEEDDRSFAVRQTPDRGYVLAGITFSSGAGGRDAHVIKTGPDGEIEWERTFGHPGDDVAHSIALTEDHGYIVFGYTAGFDTINTDAWLIRLDEAGETMWTRTIGGGGDDRAIIGTVTGDGGFVFSGTSSTDSAGHSDVYVVRTDSIGTPLWSALFGGTGRDFGYGVATAEPGTYAVTGHVTTRGLTTDSVVVELSDPDGIRQLP